MKPWKALTIATLLATTLNFSAQAATPLEESAEPNIEVNKNDETGAHDKKFEEFKQKREERIKALPKKQQKEIKKLEEEVQEKREDLHEKRKELFDKLVEYGAITKEEAQQIKEHHKHHHHQHSAK